MRPEARGVLRGVALVARFRAEGLACFGDSARQVLNSLAPLIAFPAAFLVLLLLSGGATEDAAELLSAIDALLLQTVLSEAVARRWGREGEWGRYAVAVNWCQWAVPVMGMLLLIGVHALVTAGLSPQAAAPLVVLALAGYALALQWFIAWKGLRLGRGRAGLLVLGINLLTIVMVIVPTQLRLLLREGS
jgi:hypothetical protein